MGEPGIEPGPPNGEDFKSPASASSATRPLKENDPQRESRKPSWQWKRIRDQNQIPEVRKRRVHPIWGPKKYRNFRPILNQRGSIFVTVTISETILHLTMAVTNHWQMLTGVIRGGKNTAIVGTRIAINGKLDAIEECGFLRNSHTSNPQEKGTDRNLPFVKHLWNLMFSNLQNRNAPKIEIFKLGNQHCTVQGLDT